MAAAMNAGRRPVAVSGAERDPVDGSTAVLVQNSDDRAVSRPACSPNVHNPPVTRPEGG
jgi:hypothetical protein